MKGFKKLLSLLLVVAMCFSLVACSTPSTGNTGNTGNNESNTDEQTEAGKKVFKYSITADAETLDPTMMNSITSATVGFHIYEGLMRNHMGEVQNGIAESYEVSEDGLVYTFHLRDAKWSDGVEIKAQDFEYALKRVADPATASDYVFLIANLIKNASEVNSGELSVDELGVKAVDEKTLTIELQNPTSYFTSMLSMSVFLPIRQDIVEKYGKEYSTDADKNVYCGPFVVSDWKHEDRIILEKNENYWDKDSIKLDEVNILTVSDPMTAVAMFEQGQLDIVPVPAEVAGNYENVNYYFDGSNDFIKLNMDGSSELDNKDLRLAINYAMNREDYISLTSKNIYQANTRYVLPQVKGVEGEYGTEYPLEAFPVKGDAAKAKEHLDAAMEALGISDPASLDLELITTDNDRARIEAEVIQNQLQTTLGITVSIRQVAYKQRLQMEADHEFEMIIGGWVPDYSDPMSYLELWTSDSSYNQGSYFSDEYDAYIVDARTNTDPKARMEALFNAEKLLLEDAAIVPLQLRRNGLLINPKLEGFETYFVGLNYDYIYADIVE